MELTETILKRWRNIGLIEKNPTAIEREMAYEAALAVHMFIDSQQPNQYDISWRTVWLIVILVTIEITCLFYFIY